MAKITIYTTATCAFCHAEKAYFDEKGIDYEEVRVDQDPKAAQEMVQLSGQMAVPFTVIETKDAKKEMILGFDKQRISQLLDG